MMPCHLIDMYQHLQVFRWIFLLPSFIYRDYGGSRFYENINACLPNYIAHTRKQYCHWHKNLLFTYNQIHSQNLPLIVCLI
jgi:hypothetical protein